MNWLIAANSKIYDHASSFEHHGFIDWRQNNTHYKVDDVVYIYCTTPIQKIRYKCQVLQIGIPFHLIRDDKEYWKDENEYKQAQGGNFFRLKLLEQIDSDKLTLDALKTNGPKAAPQSPKRLSSGLLSYIESVFELETDDYFPEVIPVTVEISEGLKKTIIVNKYERSSIARALCIEHNGLVCKICDFDFRKTYGEIGENFIHIHHIIPLHQIGSEYKINYKNDLIPVCPNCHAMLHRKIDSKEPSIEQLKAFIKTAKQVTLS